MPENNQILSLEGQLCGIPLAGPESFSAQQLDYLKRALGVDETVLWEDSTGIAATNETAALSESIANFEKVAFYSEPIYGGALIRNECNVADLAYRFSTGSLDGNNVFIAQYNVTISTTTVTVSRSRRVSITYAGAVTTTDLSATGSYKAPIRKIVGIHRIAGGN